MPADVYEDSLELTVGILEAVLPDNGQYVSTAYPNPSLKPTGRTEKRTFRTVVLENPYIKATIVPDLGGRILRLLDKRTSAEILPMESLLPQPMGLRGVEMPQGIQIRYGNSDRLNALGTVNVQPVPPDDDEDDAGVWIGEIGVGLSLNALVSIPPDAAELHIELRMFNRLLANSPYNGGLSLGLPDVKTNVSSIHDLAHGFGFVAYSKSRDCGLSVWCDDADTTSARHNAGRLLISRFSPRAKFSLGPRQLDTWRFRINPISSLGWNPAASPDLAVEVSSKGCRIQAHRKLVNPKLLVLTKAGQSLESSLTVYPELIHEISFQSLPSKAREIAIIESDMVRLRHQVGARFAPLDSRRLSLDEVATQETKSRLQTKPALLQRASLLPTVRAEALLLKAASLSGTGGRPVEAAHHLEQALLYNSEDHLAWWHKALLERGLQPETAELADILNAHFLAPLEPALRAEGFLGQAQTMVRDANPILAPLEEAPEQFIEVACALLEINLLAEASRFLDEALRHLDLPMLHYLQAHALLSGTNMRVDAAQHVQAASSAAYAPPFPWRQTELNALRALEVAFPDDPRIKQYLLSATLYKGPQSILSTR